MTDIIEELRACDCGVHCKSGCIQEKAAAEIERLRKRELLLLDYLDRLQNENTKLDDECQNLRDLAQNLAGIDESFLESSATLATLRATLREWRDAAVKALP